MSDEAVIRVENLSKDFRLPHEKHNSLKSAVVNFYRHNKGYEMQKALKNVSFEIKKGEFFGIVGRNGSGKSTMLRLLAGIYVPSKGAIHVNGKLIPFIELGVGFNQDLSGRENVFLNGSLLGFSRKEISAMYDDIVAFAELERFMDQKLKNYSSGMQVRLAFSIAVKAQGDILLLDEVLAVGDAAFQQKCYNYFEELKLEKQTVVFVSHDMGAIRRFCTRAAFFDNGVITHQGSPIEIADIYAQENINQEPEGKKDNLTEKNRNKINSTVTSQTDNETLIKIDYVSGIKEEVYVGISILKDGISIAEITTPLEKTLKNSGVLHYSLNTNLFNGGTYDLAAALFRKKNKELLAFMKYPHRFIIKGSDLTRGAALKLPDSWII